MLSHTSDKIANSYFSTFLWTARANHSYNDSWWVITYYTSGVSMPVTEGGGLSDQLSLCYRKTSSWSLIGKKGAQKAKQEREEQKIEELSLAAVEYHKNMFLE